MMLYPVYRPLAPYFLFRAVEAKILVLFDQKEQVSSKRTHDLLAVLPGLPMGTGILLCLQLISFLQQVPRHIKCLTCESEVKIYSPGPCNSMSSNSDSIRGWKSTIFSWVLIKIILAKLSLNMGVSLWFDGCLLYYPWEEACYFWFATVATESVNRQSDFLLMSLEFGFSSFFLCQFQKEKRNNAFSSEGELYLPSLSLFLFPVRLSGPYNMSLFL